MKEPKITTNDSKFSRGRVEKLRDKLELFTIVEKLYPNYTYTDNFVKDGVFIDSVYCYIKLFAATPEYFTFYGIFGIIIL